MSRVVLILVLIAAAAVVVLVVRAALRPVPQVPGDPVTGAALRNCAADPDAPACRRQ